MTQSQTNGRVKDRDVTLMRVTHFTRTLVNYSYMGFTLMFNVTASHKLG